MDKKYLKWAFWIMVVVLAYCGGLYGIVAVAGAFCYTYYSTYLKPSIK